MKQVEVVHANKAYHESVPYSGNPLGEVRRFGKDASEAAIMDLSLEARVEQRIKRSGLSIIYQDTEDGTPINYQAPGQRPESTLDRYIKKFTSNLYLAAKGVTVLHPGPGKKIDGKFGFDFAYPFNIAPEDAHVMFIIIDEINRSMNNFPTYFPEMLDKQKGGNEFVSTALHYLGMHKSFADLRGTRERVAEDLMRKYRELKSQVANGDNINNLMLLLTFSGIYETIPAFRSVVNLDPEFQHPAPQRVSVLRFDDLFSNRDTVRYIASEELGKVDIGRRFAFINEKEPHIDLEPDMQLNLFPKKKSKATG